MAVTISTSATLEHGGAVVETSGGVKYAIFLNGTGTNNSILVYKNIDGTPSLEDSESHNDIYGSSGIIEFIHAAIDSNDDIHVVTASSVDITTTGIAYRVWDCGTDAWLSSWELVSQYTEAAPTNPSVAISIDSSDIPHVLFVDRVKQSGSTQDNVYYDNRSGGTWSSRTQVGTRPVKTDSYRDPSITLRNSDYIEASYRGGAAGAYHKYRSDVGSGFGTEGSHILSGAYTISSYPVISTTGGTVYRYHPEATNGIEENNSATGYSCGGAYAKLSVVLVDNSDRYIFYIDGGDDIHLISNDGGGWTDEGDLQIGTYEYVIAEWAYNNENQLGEINYIFEANGAIYYGAFSLGAGAPPPRLHPLRIWNRR